MQVASYVVTDNDIEALPEAKKRFLAKQDIKLFMAIVGSLIWIQGIRFDIIFCVLFLSWHTHAPRQHHLDVAYHLIGYLKFTQDMPLVLGGTEKIQGHHFFIAVYDRTKRALQIANIADFYINFFKSLRLQSNPYTRF